MDHSSNKQVFISYSHDSEEHKAWVRKLAEDLVKNGLKVKLDQWDLNLSSNLYHFMEKSVAESDFTLIVCTKEFAKKVDGRMGGAGNEADLIIGEMMRVYANKDRFIPLLRNGPPSETIPRYLGNRLYASFENDHEYSKKLEELLRRIYDAPLYVSPSIGPIPDFANRPTVPVSASSSPKAKILVAGLGVEMHITDQIKSISQKLGSELAINNFGLITGGWPGVDEIVARAYSEELLNRKLPLENYLTQIILKTRMPVYTGGNLILVNSGEPEWSEPVLACDAIVLVNGIGGTYITGQYGVDYGKPVFPLADTGNDSRKMYLEIIFEWEKYQYKHITKSDFQRLGEPTEYALNSLMNILNSLFK